MVKNNKKHLNGYSGGMNKDLSHNLYDNKRYLHSEWFTPVNNETGDVGKMVNPKGTIHKISLPEGGIVIGESTLRDKKIIIFVKDDLSGIPATYITKFIDDGTNDTQTLDEDSNFITIYTDEGLPDEDKLGYTSSDKLDIVTRYETDIIQKIYIACEGFPLRYMNIIENSTFNNYSNYTQSDFNIIPIVNLSYPTFVNYESGNLKAGIITYSYQQYKKYGTETSFSGTCEPIYISSTINEEYLKNIKGSDIEDNSGIGVRLKIENLDTKFDGVRILAFHYTNYNAEPEVRICYEGDVYGNTLELIDTGKSLGNYDLGLFRVFNSFIPKPKHLTTKNNILFPANMEEEYFDLDYYLKNSDIQSNQELLTTDPDGNEFYDTRIFRFSKVIEETTEETTVGTTTLSDRTLVYDETDPTSSVVMEHMSNDVTRVIVPNIYDEFSIPSERTVTGITGISDYGEDELRGAYEYESDPSTTKLFYESELTYPDGFISYNTSTEELIFYVDSTNTYEGDTVTNLVNATLAHINITYTYEETITTTTSSGEAVSKLKESDGSTYIVQTDGSWEKKNSSGTVIDSGTNWNIYDNSDCINEYNDVDKNNYYLDNPTKSLRYDKNGNTGGSGLNIDLEFGTRTGSSSEASYGYTISGTKKDSWRITSFQRDEIYRLSAQFEDYLGRKSYPKWLLDCRMPNHGEEDYHDEGDISKGSFSYSYNNFLYLRSLYPRIKVKNIPKNPDGSYMKFRILRTKRTGYDCTVLGNALVNPIVKRNTSEGANYHNSFDICSLSEYNSGSWLPPDENGSYDLDKKFVEIISPEINFNKDFNLNSCIINPIGTLRYDVANGYYYRRGNLSDSSGDWKRYSEDSFSFQAPNYQIVRKFSDYHSFSNVDSKKTYAKILHYKKVEPQDRNEANYSLSGKVCRNENIYEWSDGYAAAEHGTHIAAVLDRNFSFDSSDVTDDGFIYALIKKDTTPYGGNTYNSRLNNEYIPASMFYGGDSYASSPEYVTIDQGDVFISLFDYLRSQLSRDIDYAEDHSYQEIIYMPCETGINLDLRNDDSFSKIVEELFYINSKLTEKGMVDIDLDVEIPKLYSYNTVYSRENDVEIYKPIVENNTNDYEYDCRIRRSQIKYNGEFVDSWLKFLPDDYLDVDSQYGEIMNLLIFKDRLLYFQETGFGTVPVGEKELIPSNNSSTLALGSSGILNRYDYISDTIGISQKEAILLSPNVFYLFSHIRNTMYRYTGNNEPISDIKGLNSWFDENVNFNTQVVSKYNPVLKEILFSFDNYVLSFNELSNNYAYFYPYNFNGISRFILFKNNLYSINNTENFNNIYKHNMGDRGFIHDNYYDSKLIIIVNPDSNSINVYDIIEFLTRVLNSSEEELIETFTSIKIYNDYQTTGEIILTPDSNIKRRFRTWRFNKFRDNTSTAIDPRIRSDNIKIELKFTNTNNKKILIDNIITNYRPSKMMY